MNLSLPTVLTLFRLLMAPTLLILAWLGYERLFIVGLILAFTTDAIDGPIARKLHKTTVAGSKLDTWADVSIYLMLPLSAWLLWPGLIEQEIIFVLMIVTSVLFPGLVGFIKFRQGTSYHTWLVKIAAVFTAISSLVLFIYEFAIPFRVAAIVCLFAGLEEILITLILKHNRSNVKSLWHVWITRHVDHSGSEPI